MASLRLAPATPRRTWPADPELCKFSPDLSIEGEKPRVLARSSLGRGGSSKPSKRSRDRQETTRSLERTTEEDRHVFGEPSNVAAHHQRDRDGRGAGDLYVCRRR